MKNNPDDVNGAASGDNVDVVAKPDTEIAAQDSKKKNDTRLRTRPVAGSPATRPRVLNVTVPERASLSSSTTERTTERRTATFTDPVALESATSTQQRQAVSTFDMDRIAIRHASLTPSLKIDALQAAAPAAATAAPARFVTNLVSALGLRPSPVTPARPVMPLPRLLELAFVAIRRTFFNETPTARLDPDTFEVNTRTGVATGQIVGDDPDGDRLTYRLQSPPAQGSVELGPDGSFTYTPQDGWTHTTGGDVEFTVAVSDATSRHLHLFTGGGHETTYTVRFSYDAVNNDPAVQVSGGDVQSDGTVKYTVRTSDSDGDPVELTTSSTNGALTGGLSSVANGVKVYEYTFTPDKKYAHDLTFGGKTDPGEGTATFKATDEFGGETAVTRTIAIKGTNAAPVMTVAPQANGVYEITVTDSDNDPVTLTPSVTHGTLTGGETATKGVYRYTFTVDPAYAHDLTKDGATGTGTATVGFTAHDDHGGTTTPYSQNITVTGTNAAPVMTVAPQANGVYEITVTDSDNDPVTLTPSVTHGTLTGGETTTKGVYRYTFTVDPAYAHDLTKTGATTGTATVGFTARDDHGGTADPYSDTITVVGVNSEPTAVINGSTQISTLDGIARFTITGASDADGDAARTTGVTAVPGSGASVVDNGDNTWTVTYQADFEDAHPLGPNGSFDVRR